MNKKRILIIGSNESFSLEKMYYRSFSTLNCKVKILNVYKIHRNIFVRFFWKFFKSFFFYFYRKKVLNYLTKNKNFDIIIIFKGIYFDLKTIVKIKKICKFSKILNIYPDDPFNISSYKDISSNNVLKTINLYDYFFIWSEKIKKKIEKKFKSKNIFILPFGYDQFIHKIYKKNKKKYLYDVSFIGTADIDRISIIKKLNKLSLFVAGSGWTNIKLNKKVKKKSAINSFQASQIYNNSKISLNILRKQNYDSHNMKTFEIPSMNGLMLTRKSRDQNSYFQENKACMMYNNNNDLVPKIKSILSNYNQYEKIRKYGFKISKKHSYKNRAKYILSIINRL